MCWLSCGRPKPENTVIANILSNILIIVQSSFEDDKTDVIQPLSMFFQACVSVSASRDVLELLCFSYPGGEDDETKEDSLFAWTDQKLRFEDIAQYKLYVKHWKLI